jgi:cytoskeletal protein CcmA (bactofilin family)
VVLEGAKISAEIDIGTIIISGEVKGNIRAKNSVEIRSPGRIYGNIQTPSLTIEKGVIFEGGCKMENLSKSNTPSFSSAQNKKQEPEKKEEKV